MKRFFKIFLIAVAAFICFVLILGPMVGRHYQNKYMRQEYKPEEIKSDSIGDFPKACRIEGIPWISHKKAYCQSTALMMIARENGIKEDLGYFNFLMGFTYGGFFRSDLGIFHFYEDPIPGLRVAAPYLGLKTRYFTTDEKDIFLKAVRFYISKGYPVIIELDAGKLWGETIVIPHSELFVGYDENGFEYFETGREDKFKAGAKGLKVDNEKLIAAITGIAKEFRYPWKFFFIIFEKGDKRKEDLKEIWLRNGNSLIGKKLGLYASGSCAIEQFALKLKEKGEIKYSTMLEPSAYTRLDNAQFLRKYFRGDREIEKAAGFLKESGKKYEKFLELVRIGDKEKNKEASKLLFEIAPLEKNAGEIFLKKGEK